METRLIPGVLPPVNDAAVLQLLAKATDPYGPSGLPMNIALLATDGRIYRTVTTWGLGEYMSVTQGLQALGWENTGRTLLAFDTRFEDVFSY